MSIAFRHGMTVFPEIGNQLFPEASAPIHPGSMLSRVQKIKESVCVAFGVEMHDLNSDRRARYIARPRQAAYLLAKLYTKASLPAIGNRFRRDHTAVMHGIDRARHLIETDPDFAAKYKAAERMLHGTN